jgi:hypothetical protein
MTTLELVNLIGAHLGLKPSKDLTKAVLQHLSSNPPSLLILDELETLWEPASSHGAIEELLSLLTGVKHLALMASKWLLNHILNSPHLRLPCEEQNDRLKSYGLDLF